MKLKTWLLLILPLALCPNLLTGQTDSDEDGLVDAFEMELAERFKPILHTHAYDLQAGLASIEEWTEQGSGLGINVGGWEVNGQLNLDLFYFYMYYNPNPNFHQSFNHVWPGSGPACSYGYNEYAPDERFLRLDFADSKKYAEAPIGNRPLYFHVYPNGAYVQLQYWYFLAYNDLRQYNQTIQDSYHEGDWEHVEIRLVASGNNWNPYRVNFYQHHGGYTRNAVDCWWSDDAGGIQQGWDSNHEHLNVYIAANAHASYNRFDNVYHLRVETIFGDEDYIDNVDYASANPNTFDYDLLVNLGALEYESNVNCYCPLQQISQMMDDHWTPIGDITPDWLAWSGYFGGEYWGSQGGDVNTPPPTSPGFNRYWNDFPVNYNYFGHEGFPISWWFWELGWVTYDPDPSEGDTPGREVLGSVSGTWTQENNPYTVIGNAIVPAGQTLTIEPGVQVYFNPGYKITANGVIDANGNSTNPILLVSAQDSSGLKLKSDLLRLQNGAFLKPGSE